MRDFLATHHRRRRVVPRALLVGVLAGLLAIAYRACLASADDARTLLFGWAHRYPLAGPLVAIVFSSVTASLAIWLVRRFSQESSGSGIPHVEAVLHRMQGMRWQRILPVKFVGGVLAMSGGLALGREGPTVQMGASVGQMVGTWFRHRGQERRTLIAAGAAAGLAAAFNAPLAGLVFVVEELQRDFATGVFTAAFMSAVSADLVVRLVSGQLPVPGAPPLQCVPVFIAIGLVCGILGVAFNRGLLLALDLFGRLQRRPAWVTGGIVGVFIGVVGWYYPVSLGDGHHLIDRALTHGWPIESVLAVFALRFLMTMVSYGSGAPGGIFAPLLVLGAQAGLAVGGLAVIAAPSLSCEPATFAVVGMAAYFTAIVRAPLTGIVLIVEMTANYSLMMALLTACLAAYFVADLCGSSPIYEALLQRHLTGGRDKTPLRETVLVETSILPGAHFAGKSLREIGLPAGCLFVNLRRGGQDVVPTGSTVLREGDRVVAAIAPQAVGALDLLKVGSDPEFARAHADPP